MSHIKFENSVYEDILQMPDLINLNCADEDASLLISAIRKIKISQMIKLARDIAGSLEGMFDDVDVPIARKLLDLAILNVPLTDKQYDAIFAVKISPTKQVDKQLEEEFSKPELERHQDLKEVIYRLRHENFLSKYDVRRNNEHAFLERFTEHYLTIAHSMVSQYFLNPRCILNDDESNLIKKLFPVDILLSQKVARRKAHATICLTLYEAQRLITTIIHAFFEKEGVVTTIGLEVSEEQKRAYHYYTKEQEFALLNDIDSLTKQLDTGRLNPNMQSAYDGTTLLMQALIRKCNKNTLEILLSSGANPSAVNIIDYSVSHHLAEEMDASKIRCVLARVSDFSPRDRGGYEPIYVAAEMNNVNFVIELKTAVKKKIELDSKDEVESDVEKSFLVNVKSTYTMQKLLNDQRNRYRNTALHAAVRTGSTETIQILIDEGANIYARDKGGRRAIDIANEQTISKIRWIPNNFYLLNDSGPCAEPDHANSKAKSISEPVPLAMIMSNLNGFDLSSEIMKNELINVPNTFVRWSVSPTQNEIPSSMMQKHLIFQSEQRNSIRVICSTVNDYMEKDQPTFAMVYKRICELASDSLKKNIPATAFCFEFVKAGFLEHIKYLQMEATPIQVAIDKGEITFIKDYLDKDHECQMIKYYPEGTASEQFLEMSAIDYAISKGMVEVVKFFLAYTTENPGVRLNNIPDNAIDLAITKQQALANVKANQATASTVSKMKDFALTLLLSDSDEKAIKEIDSLSLLAELEKMYEFTFRNAMYEVHEYTAKKLQKENLYQSAKFRETLNFVAIVDLDALRNAVQNKYDAYCIFSYLIRNKKLSVFNAIFRQCPAFSSMASMLSLLCVRSNTLEIFKIINDNYDFKNTAITLWRLAKSYASAELQIAVLNKIEDESIIVLNAIKEQSYAELKLILSHMKQSDKTLFQKYKLYLENAPESEAVISILYEEVTRLANHYYLAIPYVELINAILSAGNQANVFFFIKKVLSQSSMSEFLKGDSFYSVLVSKIDAFELEKIIKLLLDYNKREFSSILKKSDKQGLNIFQVAFGAEKIASMRIIQKYVPLNINTRKMIALYASAIRPNDNIEYLSALNEFKIPLPSSFDEKLALVNKALKAGPHTLDWLFAEGHLNKDDLCSKRNNYLLALCLAPKKEVTIESVKNMHYLVNTIEVDINAKNVSGQCLVLGIDKNTPDYVVHFIYENAKTDFTARDQFNNTALHILGDRITVARIEQFIERGGDIHAKNNDGLSSYSNYIKVVGKQASCEVIEKFKQLGCVIAPYYFAYSSKFMAIINNSGAGKYILVNGADQFIHPETEINICSFYNLNCTGEEAVNEGFDFKVSYSTYKKPFKVSKLGWNFRWIKLPTQFEPINEGLYRTVDTEPSFIISPCVKLLLEYFGGINQTVIISPKDYAAIQQAARAEKEQFKNKIIPVLESNAVITASNNDLCRNAILQPHLPFSLHMLANDHYLDVTNLSPLAISILTGANETLKILLRSNHATTNDHDYATSELLCALTINNTELAESLDANFSYNSMLSGVEFHINNNIVNGLAWLLERITNKFPSKTLAFKTALQNIVKNSGSSSFTELLMAQVNKLMINAPIRKKSKPNVAESEKMMVVESSSSSASSATYEIKSAFFTLQEKRRTVSSTSSSSSEVSDADDEVVLKRRRVVKTNSST